MNLFWNTGFETNEYWEPTGLGEYSSAVRYSGLRSMRLRCRQLAGGGVYVSTVRGKLTRNLRAGEVVTLAGKAKNIVDAQQGTFSLKAYWAQAEFGPYYLFGSTNFFSGGWDNIQYWNFEAPADGEYWVLFQSDLTQDPAYQEVSVYLDDVEANVQDLSETIVRSNLPTWLANLKDGIEDLDENFGPVFIAERRWNSADQLRDDGAVIEINVAGLVDDSPEDLGTATRFWILEPWIHSRPLTNLSDEYEGRVRIVGFFGYREEETEAIALRNAATEIVDWLNLKATELTTLAAGMGTGYMGYLTDRPAMVGPVKGARLQTGAQGHVAIITAGYLEEVSRE